MPSDDCEDELFTYSNCLKGATSCHLSISPLMAYCVIGCAFVMGDVATRNRPLYMQMALLGALTINRAQ